MHIESTIEDLFEFVDLVDEFTLRAWIGGGWGVDLLLGRQTRTHQDIDIVISPDHSDTLVRVLKNRGYRDIPTRDRSPWNFVLGTDLGKYIDFHIFQFHDDGRITYSDPRESGAIESGSLDGMGRLHGRNFRCLSAKYQIETHSGYQLKQQDIDDVTLLSEKFGIPLLPDQLAFDR